MKNEFRPFLALIVVASLSSLPSLHAQNECVDRGNFSIGSGLGYTNSVANIEIDNGGTVHRGGITAYQIHLTPSIGYFLANNFVLGLGMDYLVNSSKNTDAAPNGAQNIADTKLLFGPYTRLYLPFADDQAFFLGAVYGYGKSETQIVVNGDRQTAHVVLSTLGAGPGYSIFSNRHVALEAQVKYNYGISQSDFLVDGVSQSARTRVTSWDFVVGIHFYFIGQNSSSNQGN
ncbi:MAG: hypothetical protein SGI94_16240 [Saprospiraceae bacterium]|nr:hypothetical protein [Saprospiraceae bacterium]